MPESILYLNHNLTENLKINVRKNLYKIILKVKIAYDVKQKCKITIKSGFVNSGWLIKTNQMTTELLSIKVHLFQNVKRSNNTSR